MAPMYKGVLSADIQIHSVNNLFGKMDLEADLIDGVGGLVLKIVKMQGSVRNKISDR